MVKPIPFPSSARPRPSRGSILVLEHAAGAPRGYAVSSPLSEALEAEGHMVSWASTARDALQKARRKELDLVLADCRLPDMKAVELLDRLHQIDRDLPVVVLTDSGDVEMAVSCIRDGAYDYIPRPLHLGNLLVTVNNALEQRRLRGEVSVLRKQVGGRDAYGALVGRSEAMQAVFRRIAKIAPHDTTVLILGESGTGKEMVAREIHRRSPVAEGPFIPVNCGGVPGDLIESELYGHERGAFTGAAQARDGLFHAAANGTLFLDEIGAMPLLQQSSLLRALEKKEIRRVGGTRTFQVDVRVIAATNSDLEQAMEEGSFRQDLYYRLSRLVIHLPSLRERVEDIPVLCAHFLARYCEEHGRPPRRLSPQALDVLCNRRWPGNVRELENAVEQAVLFSHAEVIKPSDIPFDLEASQEAEPLTLEQVEREHIRAVLARTAGNKLKAARILGIPRPTLYHRMRKLGLVSDQRGTSPSGRTDPSGNDV